MSSASTLAKGIKNLGWSGDKAEALIEKSVGKSEDEIRRLFLIPRQEPQFESSKEVAFLLPAEGKPSQGSSLLDRPFATAQKKDSNQRHCPEEVCTWEGDSPHQEDSSPPLT